LPVQFGGVVSYPISADQLHAASLPDRFAHLPGRILAPDRDATAIQLSLGPDDCKAYRRRLGFGEIVVLPYDVGQLRFNEQSSAIRFWNQTLQNVLEIPQPNQGNSY